MLRRDGSPGVRLFPFLAKPGRTLREVVLPLALLGCEGSHGRRCRTSTIDPFSHLFCSSFFLFSFFFFLPSSFLSPTFTPAFPCQSCSSPSTPRSQVLSTITVSRILKRMPKLLRLNTMVPPPTGTTALSSSAPRYLLFCTGVVMVGVNLIPQLISHLFFVSFFA